MNTESFLTANLAPITMGNIVRQAVIAGGTLPGWRRLVFVVLLVPICTGASPPQLCTAVPPSVLQSASKSYPAWVAGFQWLFHHPFSYWFTNPAVDLPNIAKLMTACNPSMPVIVVYYIPNRDCSGSFSSGGAPSTLAYNRSLAGLAAAVGNNRVLYIVEPDALANVNSCPQYASSYLTNLRSAVSVLGNNTNATIYLDVGLWALGNDQNSSFVGSTSLATSLSSNIKKVDPKRRCRGISLNVSNYHATNVLVQACNLFHSYTDYDYRCVIDTSRNFNGDGNLREWCNYKGMGVGAVPTSNTSYPLVDYFLWVKTIGASDGQCTGRTSDALVTNIAAGNFFPLSFQLLFNQSDVPPRGLLDRQASSRPPARANTSHASVLSTKSFGILRGTSTKGRFVAPHGTSRFRRSSQSRPPTSSSINGIKRSRRQTYTMVSPPTRTSKPATGLVIASRKQMQESTASQPPYVTPTTGAHRAKTSLRPGPVSSDDSLRQDPAGTSWTAVWEDAQHYQTAIVVVVCTASLTACTAILLIRVCRLLAPDHVAQVSSDTIDTTY